MNNKDICSAESPTGEQKRFFKFETEKGTLAYQYSSQASGAMASASKGLVMKVAKVLTGLHRMPKEGFNPYHRFAYFTEGQVVNEIRALLGEVGLAIFVEITGVGIVPWAITAGGCVRSLHIVHTRHMIVDGESGDCVSFHWMGESLDEEDKGIAKALTAAQKSFLIKTFLLGSLDGPPATWV